MGSYSRQEDSLVDPVAQTEARAPSSTGLIRLSLKKPMGIVFEPMYDPNQPSVQRGVRICDLPRTGAAALSRKLQVGDELLQINDTTVSRLTFDEIMDFIIEADPESVNLLFRRPRKETLQARQGVQQKINAATNKDAPSTVKWVDEEHGDKKKAKERKSAPGKKKDSKKATSKKKKDVSEEEEETLQSSTVGEESYVKPSRGRKKAKTRRGPYESESFLDLLIDTICSNSNNMCRDAFRRPEEDFSEDEESFVSEAVDEETYTTYDESVEQRAAKQSRKKQEEATTDENQDRRQRPERKEKVEKIERKPEKKKYEDDGTLETVESADRGKEAELITTPKHPPLGLAPQPVNPQPILPTGQSDGDDEGVPAPIKEVEYDDRIDHGADVSVMESLGGPSLLIEKQRAAAQAAVQETAPKPVPAEVVESFGLDYPSNFGLTREQTIQGDPLKFYTHVVRGLLDEHEPEKVRLLDKLLAKYKGREDHLVQKLSVRYTRPTEVPEVQEDDDEAFSDAVKKSKASSTAAAAVNTAKERLHNTEEPEEFRHQEWPEKEEKEPEIGDDGAESETGSEYSKDSVDGTSPAVIAQVSELLNYVYGKTSVPGQIDRVSTIMRAYEGREAVLLELLETKALIKANKEKENAENLPSFLRNTQMSQAQKNAEELEAGELPPVTPMATQARTGTVINDDISSMSGVSSPAPEQDAPGGIVESVSDFCENEASSKNRPLTLRAFRKQQGEEVDVSAITTDKLDPVPMAEAPKTNGPSSKSSAKPPFTPDKDRKKKKGLFGGLFGKKKKDLGGSATPASRAGSRSRNGRKS